MIVVRAGLAFFVACVAMRAQVCPVDRRPIPVPVWRQTVEPGTQVLVAAGKETITQGTPPLVLSNPPGAAGALSESTFPEGPPWPFNASGSSTCPGVEPGGDCSGKRIPRLPAAYAQFGPESGTNGFEFLGSFAGRLAPDYKPGSMLVQSVFFHQNPLYLGGAEYGFYYELTPGPSLPPRIVFYWSTNSNCGHQPSICRTEQHGGLVLYENGGTEPPPPNRVHGCLVQLPRSGTYLYQTWLFKDTDGISKFRIRILDPRTRRSVTPPMSIDPNISGGNWFPAAELETGYFTAGMVKSDPEESMKEVEPVLLKLRRLRVARPSGTR